MASSGLYFHALITLLVVLRPEAWPGVQAFKESQPVDSKKLAIMQPINKKKIRSGAQKKIRFA